jgi:N-acyl-D-aspartate/D-glutamate deacylase
VVLGNCGVTFAPCKPDDRAYLAAMTLVEPVVPTSPVHPNGAGMQGTANALPATIGAG